VGQFWPKVEEDNPQSADIVGLYSITVTQSASKKLSNSVKECKIRDTTPFKVIQGHRCRY